MQVIEKELKEANQIILNLEKQLKDKDTPFGENLETIKKIDLKDLAEELKIQLSIETIREHFSYTKIIDKMLDYQLFKETSFIPSREPPGGK